MLQVFDFVLVSVRVFVFISCSTSYELPSGSILFIIFLTFLYFPLLPDIDVRLDFIFPILFHYYSAGKRDRGKKKKKNLAPLARAKEGPKAPTQARSTEEEAEGLRRLGRTQAPPEKKVFNES